MNIEQARHTIADCDSYLSCVCFSILSNLPPFNSENYIECIHSIKTTLQTYYKLLVRHLNKDQLLHQSFFSWVSAETLKKAYDHHIDSLHKFKRYLLPKFSTDKYLFKYDGHYICVLEYVNILKELKVAQEKTNRFFHHSYTQIPTQQIIEELDIHLYTIQLFDEFIKFVDNGKINCKENLFKFKKEKKNTL